MKLYLKLASLLLSATLSLGLCQTLWANEEERHEVEGADEYLSGYLQALVDANYCEYQVRVLVKDHKALVFNLPKNELLARSILCFIADSACISCVQRMHCSPEEYLCSIIPAECAPEMESMCNTPLPCCQVRGIWFPDCNRLFAPLVADPRQVTNSAALRFNDDVIGKHVGACTFGDEFPFFRWKDVFPWCGDLQIGVEAGIFAVFDLDHPDAAMVNTDFFVAPSLTYAINAWSFRLRLWHLSSHIGDEFLIANPGFTRLNLSDEGADFFASYYYTPAIRLYAGIGDIFSHDKTFQERPLYFEYGTEIRLFGCRDYFNKLYIQPFLAMHFRNWEEHDFELDSTYVLGVEYSKIQAVGRKFRIFGEYHQGFCKEGQFVRLRCKYLAFRIMYGF